MTTKIVKHDVWSLLSDREALTSVSDAVIVKATDRDATKAGAHAVKAQATALLAEVDSPEKFGEALATFVGTYGSAEELARVASVTRAASALVSAGLRVFVVKAYESGWVGRGKAYTNATLAEACGVSKARISQLTPEKFRTGTGGRPASAPAPTEESTPAEESTPEESTPASPVTALAQALTRLEKASAQAFTPEDYAEVERVANALDAISRNLRYVVKGAATA